VQFCIVSSFLIMCYTGSLIWVYAITENNKKIVQLAYTLGSVSVQIKMAFLIFSENLARQKTIKVPDSTESLYSAAHVRGYELGNDLTKNIQDFPAGFSSYQDYLKALLLQGVCQNYLEPVRNINCRDDSVLMSGLELINIKILEYAQQNLARIATDSDPWGGSSWTKTLALYNSDFLTSESYVEYSGYTYSDTLVHFISAYGKATDSADTVATITLAGWLIIIILGFAWLIFKYLKNLSKNIWRIQGMLNMIPAEIIHRNSRMREKFIEGGLAKGLK